uniref:NADH-ubiquinone oxidoreductase chain 3 n=1 Tax=Rhigonema thysanophora TaxID=435730 RepID=X2CTB6_9BILA|nr:NADH dehydrogenase subunit 3 [Rhigonema thysanophora]AGZ90405.1 NADH dehydrogenase subunit 3 [Rhigonema thysanophora]
MVFVLYLVMVFTLFFLCLFYIGNFFLSDKEGSKIKISSFESGFSTLSRVQNSFSVHFFVMMLMFVIFDLEIVMFLGVLVSDMSSFLSFLFLLLFIVGGFYMEWWYGKLVWLIF